MFLELQITKKVKRVFNTDHIVSFQKWKDEWDDNLIYCKIFMLDGLTCTVMDSYESLCEKLGTTKIVKKRPIPQKKSQLPPVRIAKEGEATKGP